MFGLPMWLTPPQKPCITEALEGTREVCAITARKLAPVQAHGGPGPVAALELRPHQGGQLHREARLDASRSGQSCLKPAYQVSSLSVLGCSSSRVACLPTFG